MFILFGGVYYVKIILRDLKAAIHSTSDYFDINYDPEWITSEFGRKVIADVDQSTVVSSSIIESPIFGPIPTRRISGGAKALLLMEFTDGIIFNASACGDNCAKWILDISRRKDLTINLRHIMDFGDETFDAVILNTGQEVHNMKEFVYVCIEEMFKDEEYVLEE